MEEPKTRKSAKLVLPKVAEVITEKPTEFKLEKKVFFFGEKLLIKLGFISNKRVFSIRPQRVVNIYRISGIVVKLELGKLFKTVDNIGAMMDFISRHGKDVFYIIACMIQNDENEPTKRMLKIVENELEMEDMAVVLKIAVNNYNISDFLTSITLIVGVDALKVAEVSPQEKGS